MAFIWERERDDCAPSGCALGLGVLGSSRDRQVADARVAAQVWPICPNWCNRKDARTDTLADTVKLERAPSSTGRSTGEAERTLAKMLGASAAKQQEFACTANIRLHTQTTLHTQSTGQTEFLKNGQLWR